MNSKIKLNYHSKHCTSLRKNILRWYDKNGRSNLPWKTNDIYKIWISEIMLQQTQVKTVIPYYKTFIKKYPDIKSLSNASFDNICYLILRKDSMSLRSEQSKSRRCFTESIRIPNSLQRLYEILTRSSIFLLAVACLSCK